MKLLVELTEKDVGAEKDTDLGTEAEPNVKAADKDITSYYRDAARAVVLNAKKEMALLHVTKRGYYKLPGGGIEKGEDKIDALNREVMEEIGCRIGTPKPVGVIIEHKDRTNLTQLSYCYLARLKGKPGKANLDEGEKALGFETEWWSMKKALSLIGSSDKSDYLSKFMVTRDAIFIRKAMKLVSGKAPFTGSPSQG